MDIIVYFSSAYIFVLVSMFEKQALRISDRSWSWIVVKIFSLIPRLSVGIDHQRSKHLVSSSADVEFSTRRRRTRSSSLQPLSWSGGHFLCLHECSKLQASDDSNLRDIQSSDRESGGIDFGLVSNRYFLKGFLDEEGFLIYSAGSDLLRWETSFSPQVKSADLCAWVRRHHYCVPIPRQRHGRIADSQSKIWTYR